MRVDRFDGGICLALLVLAAVVYAPVGEFDFVDFDDRSYVIDHVLVREGLSVDSVGRAFTRFRSANWHPLTWISHMADASAFGLDPGRYHQVNAFLHALTGCLLFVVLRRMSTRSAASTGGAERWMAATVAALFLAHPTHVESVAWISERKDVLCALFWMLTLGAYLHYARAPSLVRYLGVALAFVAALLSKPMAVMLPGVLLLLDFWPLARWRGVATSAPVFASASLGRLVLEKLPLLVLSVVSAAVTIFAQSLAQAILPLANFSLTERLGNAVVSYVRYLGLAFWPTGLSAYHPQLGEADLAPVRVLVSLLLLFILTVGAVASWRRRPFLAVGWGWFLVTLVPVIGIVQVGQQSLAERYTYLPYVGLSIAVVWGIESFWPRHRRRTAALSLLAIAAVLASAFLASRQVMTWRNPESLWTQALRSDPQNGFAHLKVSSLRIEAKQLDEAEYHALLAARYEPTMVFAPYNLGVIHVARGEAAEAREQLARALEIQEDMGLALALLAELDRGEGNLDAAIAGFEAAINADRKMRKSTQVRESLALALRAQLEVARAAAAAGQGRAKLEKALADYRRIIARNPRFTQIAADYERGN